MDSVADLSRGGVGVSLEVGDRVIEDAIRPLPDHYCNRRRTLRLDFLHDGQQVRCSHRANWQLTNGRQKRIDRGRMPASPRLCDDIERR